MYILYSIHCSESNGVGFHDSIMFLLQDGESLFKVIDGLNVDYCVCGPHLVFALILDNDCSSGVIGMPILSGIC